jgi:hypothetical protein
MCNPHKAEDHHMKNKELIKRLEEMRRKKTKLKNLYEEQFNVVHEIELELHLLLEDLYKERKK